MGGDVFVLAMMVICAVAALACLIVAIRASYEIEKRSGDGAFWKASTSRPNMLRAAFSTGDHQDPETRILVTRLRKYLIYAAIFFALMAVTALMNAPPGD